MSGARGLGRTATYKASLTYEQGWRACATIPIIGLEAGAKARRLGEELFARTNALLRQSQLPPLTRTHCDVIGGDGPDAATVPTTAICRLVADHSDQQGAQVLVQEQSSAISHMSVGISLSLAASTRPIQRIAGFLVPKSIVSQKVTVDGQPVTFAVPTDGTAHETEAPPPALPALPSDIDPGLTVPLIHLAWARSGDKGNLFNVAVIARRGGIPALYRRRADRAERRRTLWPRAGPRYRARRRAVQRARIFRAEFRGRQFDGWRHSGLNLDRLRRQGPGADVARTSPCRSALP